MTPTVPTIGVVDDDASLLRSIARLLRSLGLRPETFKNGRELLDAETLAQVDCLIVDIHMPEIGGIELARELASRGSTTPIVFISSEIPTLALEDLSLAIAILAKPFDDEQLEEVLQKALGNRVTDCCRRPPVTRGCG